MLDCISTLGRDTRLQPRSARLSIADHEASRIVEVADDEVALQG